MNNDEKFMKMAIEIAREGLSKSGNGPFGACIVKDGEVISLAHNSVVNDSDPTAHAEVNAIRKACEKLGDFELKGCTIYSTCEPCPMCLGAIYWCRLDRVVFGASRHDAGAIGFDDQVIYDEIDKDIVDREVETDRDFLREECLKLFGLWEKKNDKVDY